MSGLKSAWEISLEKTDKQNPGLKKQAKLTDEQKGKIADIRKEYQAKNADKELTLDHKIKKLGERIPPDRLHIEAEELKKQFAADRQMLDEEMEKQIEAIRNARK